MQRELKNFLSLDFEEHNRAARQLWEDYLSGHPSRVPMILGMNPRVFLMDTLLAHNAESARRLYEISKKARNICAMAYCWRFNHGVNRMKELFVGDELGDPMQAKICFTVHTPNVNETWRTDVSISGGGCLMDNGSHALDIFRYVFGPVKMAAGTTRHFWKDRGDDSAFVLIAGQNGCAGQVTVSWMFPYRELSIEGIGSKGSARYDLKDIQKLQVLTYEDNIRTEDLGEGKRFVNQMKTFLTAVGGGDCGQLATFEDGLAVAEIIESIYKADFANS